MKNARFSYETLKSEYGPIFCLILWRSYPWGCWWKSFDFPTSEVLENAPSFAEATLQYDAILPTTFHLFVLVLLLMLTAFLKQREETPCSERNQLAPMKTNPKDLLR